MAVWRNDTGSSICLSSDRSRVVACDSPDAGWMLVAAGCEIATAEAREYGLLNSAAPMSASAGESPSDSAEPAEADTLKSRAPVSDKAVRPKANKRR